jgi:protein AATF/BFR2
MKLFDFFISMRISLQKILTSVNCLPQGEKLKEYIDDTNKNMFKFTIIDMLKLLLTFIKFQREFLLKNNYSELLQSNSTNSESNDILNEITNITKIITKFIKILSESITENKNDEELDTKFLEEIINLINPFSQKIILISEKIIDIWYRKTLVYSYKSNTGNRILKIMNNNFCEHIKQNIDNNFESIRDKSKKKNGEKILGKKHLKGDENDDEIYNDRDFYNFILKEFINNKEDLVNTEANAADGTRMDLTLQYLLNRSKNKKEKNIDTKASKNRKLKFDKHEKIINFMVPLPNHKLNSGRVEIIHSIFGVNRKKEKEDDDYDSDFDLI